MILVTGAAGFIGNRLAYLLGNEAICLQRSNYIPGRVICDLTDISDVKRVAKKLKNHHITHLIHTAAITPWAKKTDFLLDLNMAESVLLLCRQLKIPQIMFISGWNVYDVSAPVPFSELTPLKPLDEYGASKLRIERFFNNELKDVQVLNLRSSSIYGPGQTSPGLITNLVKSALGSNKIILNAVSTKRDYLYIDDLAKSIIQLVALDAKSLPQTLNLGSGKSISVLEVAHSIQRICKKIRDLNISIEYAQELHESLLPDNCLAIYEAKKRGLLTKMISFEDGLSNYIEWRMNENIL